MWDDVLRNCRVAFVEKPNGVYYSGENVTGFIKLILKEPQRVTDLIFQSKGISMCQWSRRSGQTVRGYSAFVNHFTSTMSLVKHHTRDPEHHNEILLEAGSHSFPFSLTLSEDLPTSFESDTGRVRYTIKVKAIIRLKLDEKYKMAFTVISKCDLNSIPKCNLPVTEKVKNSFYTFLIRRGAAEMTISLPVSGFLPGQQIPITCSINNYSKITINEITYTFRRIVTYTAESPSNSTVVETGLVVYVGQGVDKMSESVYKVSFPVPAVPSSTTMKNQPVTIEYVLKVVAVVPMFHEDLVIHIPLKIGNIPLNTTSSQNEPGASGGDNQNNLPSHSYEPCHESEPCVVNFNSEHNNFHYTPMYPVFNYPRSHPQHGDVLRRRL